MPSRYHKGAEDAYKKNRNPYYTDQLSPRDNEEREHMMREQIFRKHQKEMEREWDEGEIETAKRKKTLRDYLRMIG